MEEIEKAKIAAVLPNLIEQVDCNIFLISELKATQAIGIADECHLVSLTNRLDRSNQLLNIMYTRKRGYNLLVESLRKTRQTGALETLQEYTDLDPINQHNVAVPVSQFAHMQISKEKTNMSGLKPFKKIPLQTKEAIEHFTGRHQELDVLLKYLLPDGGTASIIGIGGIGKTELAKMLLQTLDEEKYKNIFKQVVWINCESAFTVSTDFTNIAKDYLEIPILGTSTQQRDMSSIISDVYEKLQKSKSLVVLNDVETKEILQTCLPKSISKRSKLSILITSQNAVLRIGIQIVLENLPLDDAIIFLKKGLAHSVSQEFENNISGLVSRLQMFPLAITQAIGYINEKLEMNPNYKPQDYLSDFDRIPKRLLDGNYFSNISSQGRTTYKTLELALTKVEACQPSGLLAITILSKVAFMAADNIPSSFFSNSAENGVEAIEDALVLIKRFSLIKYTQVGKRGKVYFSVHRLVQDVLRIRIAQQNKTESILNLMMTTFCVNLDYDLIIHALETWGHAAKIRSLVAEFSNFPEYLLVKMYNLGQISDAIDFATSSLMVLKQFLSTKTHAITIFWIQALKGTYLSDQGKFKDSLENLQATLNEAKQHLNSYHWVISKLRCFIALTFIESGQYDKAALICFKLFQNFKSGDIVSLRTIYDIALLQMHLRKFDNAFRMANYVLKNVHIISARYREELEHDAKFLLALINCSMGNYDESINIYSELLQSYLKKQQSKDLNLDGWRIFHGMGICQYCSGHYEEAHYSYQKALEEISGQNEKECVWKSYINNNILSLMLAHNIVGEPLPFAIEVNEQIKKIVEKSHFLALESLANIGVAFSKGGRYQDAVLILTKLVENQVFVTRSADEGKFTKFHLALSLELIGNLEKATEILKELRLECLRYPQYKLFTLDQVQSALKRLKIKQTEINK